MIETKPYIPEDPRARLIYTIAGEGAVRYPSLEKPFETLGRLAAVVSTDAFVTVVQDDPQREGLSFVRRLRRMTDDRRRPPSSCRIVDAVPDRRSATETERFLVTAERTSKGYELTVWDKDGNVTTLKVGIGRDEKPASISFSTRGSQIDLRPGNPRTEGFSPYNFDRHIRPLLAVVNHYLGAYMGKPAIELGDPRELGCYVPDDRAERVRHSETNGKRATGAYRKGLANRGINTIASTLARGRSRRERPATV